MSTSRISLKIADTSAPAEELDQAAHILRDGFWSCNSPVLRFRAANDREILLKLMRSRVNAAASSGGLFLAYNEEGKMVGAVITSLPGEGFTQLQKNYGDQKKENTGEDESEAERKARIWVEQDLVPWFNDFSARSLGPGVMQNSLYISLFAMHKDYQGQGLGRETMNQVISWGDERGWEMTLFDHEPELVKFYSSFGFEEVGRENRACGEKDVTWWAMKRSAKST